MNVISTLFAKAECHTRTSVDSRGRTLGWCSAAAVSNETEIKQTVATSSLLAATKCTKLVFGCSSTLDPPGELMTIPRHPSQLEWGTSPSYSPPPQWVRHLDSHAFGVRLGTFGASHAAFRHFFFTVYVLHVSLQRWNGKTQYKRYNKS